MLYGLSRTAGRAGAHVILNVVRPAGGRVFILHPPVVSSFYLGRKPKENIAIATLHELLGSDVHVCSRLTSPTTIDD